MEATSNAASTGPQPQGFKLMKMFSITEMVVVEDEGVSGEGVDIEEDVGEYVDCDESEEPDGGRVFEDVTLGVRPAAAFLVPLPSSLAIWWTALCSRFLTLCFLFKGRRLNGTANVSSATIQIVRKGAEIRKLEREEVVDEEVLARRCESRECLRKGLGAK